MNARWAVVALALGGSPWSLACVIPGLSHEVAFARDSAVLSASEVRSLANWYVDLRQGSLGVHSINVSAYSTRGDAAHAVLTKQRLAAVDQLMQTLISTDPRPLETEVLGTNAAKAQAFPEVRISVEPRCALTRTCCGTDPNLR